MRNIAISEVFLIIYENGERERFAAEEQRKRMVPALLGFNIPRKTKDRNGKGHRQGFFSFGMGYGNSYGGFGGMIQYINQGDVGVGLHFGAGYFPGGLFNLVGEWPLFAGGLKIYYWKYMFVDLQFGLFGIWNEIKTNQWDKHRQEVDGCMAPDF